VNALPLLGIPFSWHPVAFGLLLFAVTPGVHLLLSFAVERRHVTWQDDYLAVLIGDPALAMAGGLGLWLADGDLNWLARSEVGLVTVSGWLVFGWWQARGELRKGRYVREQVVSPTKLFHQHVVYPVLGYLVPTAVFSGLAKSSSDFPVAAVIVLLVVLWAGLTIHAIRHPRLGHGGWDWATRKPVAVTGPGT
jgi:hypothetical protein